MICKHCPPVKNLVKNWGVSLKKKFFWIVTHIEDVIAVVALSCILIIACMNVFFRYFMNQPLTWAEELECGFLIWATFIGGAVCYKKNLHYGMDYLVDHLPAKYKYILRKCITFVLILFFAFLTYLSFEFAISAKKTTNFFQISYTYLDFAAVLGFASMTIYSVLFFIESFINPEQFIKRYVAAYEEDINDSNEAAPKEGNTL